jgi:hypothetical protein
MASCTRVTTWTTGMQVRSSSSSSSGATDRCSICTVKCIEKLNILHDKLLRWATACYLLTTPRVWTLVCSAYTKTAYLGRCCPLPDLDPCCCCCCQAPCHRSGVPTMRGS